MLNLSKQTASSAFILSIVVSLAACSETTDGGDASSLQPPSSMQSASALDPQRAAEQACLASVQSETNNPQVSVGNSEFSEAGTRVIVVVGEQQAPWECIGYRDGSTSKPMSLSNEGAL